MHVLTIGTFDGVHLGHQALFRQVIAHAEAKQLIPAALAFSTIPRNVLDPHPPRKPLCTTLHKRKLIEACGIKHLLTPPFSLELSKLSPKEFLLDLRATLPFQHLVLGHDARIGFQRVGDPEHLRELAEELEFTVEYLEPISVEGEPISSSRVRTHLLQGKLERLPSFLGRIYSFFGEICEGVHMGKKLGFPTLNMDLSDYCRPPLGVYVTATTIGPATYPSVSNLGFAPTIGERDTLHLETYLLTDLPPPTPSTAEVTFLHYLREERVFSSELALREQIAQDVESAKRWHDSK